MRELVVILGFCGGGALAAAGGWLELYMFTVGPLVLWYLWAPVIRHINSAEKAKRSTHHHR